MPKLKDLKEIKNKIHSIGNEININKDKNLPINDTIIPDGKDIKKQDTFLTEKVKKDNTEDLLSEIKEDFDQGFELKETEDIVDTGLEKENIIEDYLGNVSNPNSSIDSESDMKGEGDLDNLLGDLDNEKQSGSSGKNIQSDNIDDFLKDMSENIESTSDADADILNIDEESKKNIKDTDSMDDIDALLNNLGQDSKSSDELNISGESSSETKEKSEDPDGFDFDEESKSDVDKNNDEFSDLMSGMDEDKKDQPIEVSGDQSGGDLDDLLKDLGVSPGEEGVKSDGIDQLNELLGEKPILSEEDMMGKSQENIQEEEQIFDVHDDLSDLAGITGDEKTAAKDEGTLPEISEDNISELNEQIEEDKIPKTDEDILESIIDTSLDDIPPVNEAALSDIEKEQEEELFDSEKTEESSDQEIPPDLLSLDELSGEGFELKEEEGEEKSSDQIEESQGFDIESLDSLSDLGIEETPSFAQAEIKPEKQKIKSELKDTSFGKIPEELSRDEISNNEDIDIKLTEDDRKKIVIALTQLPKDAEIKIAKAISSNKFSNNQLKPLIDALIENKSSVSIIRYYEKITGDRSLSSVEAVKRFTGEKFEEFQKSFSYVLQKNILPLVARLLSGIFFVLVFAFLIGVIIKPAIDANIAYDRGIKKIEQKVYWEAEDYFNKGFSKQPSQKQVIRYAEKYTEYKRYKEAEKKYEFAVNYWQPPKYEIVLKYAGFLKKVKKYEQAEKKYLELIKTNDKNVEAKLGLADNYYEWSEEMNSKLIDAEDAYKNVLGLNGSNKSALFGNLKVYLKMKNHKKIIAQYNYLKSKIKKNYDPEVLSLLAEYLIDKNEIDNVKEVLDKAHGSIKKNQYIPELFYQQARYKKALKIYDEEKKHLNSALKIFNMMKENDKDRYESKKYQNILAKVYNALGENYDLSEKASVEAEKYYNKAIEADPDYGMSYYNLANFAFINKPGGEAEAKELYLRAESKGFTNDRLNYNLGIIYYKEADFYNSYLRIINLMEKFDYNSNLKFMIGTIYYKMQNYELSESMLLESYIYYNDMINRGLFPDPEDKDYMQATNMLKQISNNLGAAYQKKFENTRNTKFLVRANKYYSDSIKYLNTLEGDEVKENAHQNLRMVLYPYAGMEDPYIYDDFPNNFMSTM